LIVEDDYMQAEHLISDLKMHISNIQIDLIQFESDFIEYSKKIPEKPPDIIIIDVMLLWGRPSNNAPPEEIKDEGIYRAGFRCLKILDELSMKNKIPVIIYSVLDSTDLSEYISKQSMNCLFVPKNTDSNYLLTIICSLLPNKLVRKKNTLRKKILDAIYFKPTFFGFSVDLKQLGKTLSKNNKKH